MATSRNNIPLPIVNFNATSRLPASLMELRLSMNRDQLMNTTNNLHELIEALFNFVVQVRPSESFNSVTELLEAARSVQMFEKCNTMVPWTPYDVDCSFENWNVYDDIVVAMISVSHIYNLLTLDSLDNNYENGNLTDDAWKRSSNMLKSSFSLMQSIKPCIDGSKSTLHSENFSFIWHLNNALVQLIVVFKNIRMTYTEIDSRFGQFENLPQKLSTYLKIIIFVHNEFSTLEKINQSQKNTVTSLKAFQAFLEIVYCYYLSLEYYSQNKLGIALGIIKYALANSIDQSPIKSKLKINFNKTKLKDKNLWKENPHLKRYFEHPDFPSVFKKNLVMIVGILTTLNHKFEKLNNSLNFDNVVPITEIKKNYLFGANNLPTGLQVPLADLAKYTPSCLDQPNSQVENYF